MKGELKKLLFYFSKAIIIIICIDFVLGFILSSLFEKIEGREVSRTRYVIKECKADVIVLGSSRALNHYHPKLIGDSLRLSVYNAGIEIQNILYHATILKLIVKRHKPSIVILDINENELIFEQVKYDKLNTLLPYYNSFYEVRETVDLVNPHYRFFSWLSILPYNSYFFTILSRSIFNQKNKTDLNGYISRPGHYNHAIETENNCHDLIFDSKLQNALIESIEFCKENSIKLYVFISPRFRNYSCKRMDLIKVKEVIKSMKMPVYDFSNDEKYKSNPSLFSDQDHLNVDGSMEFSKDVVRVLRKEGN